VPLMKSAESAGKDGSLAGHFDEILARRLDELAISCGLTEVQSKKLKLAGRGDIKRLLERIDTVVDSSSPVTAGTIAETDAELRELRRAIDAPFGKGSLFAKTLVTTLSREQLDRIERALLGRNTAWYLSAVSDAVRNLALVADFDESQRQKLVRLIMSETKPPRRIGKSDHAFVMFQASKIPHARLKEIVQGDALRAIEERFASWSDFRPALENEGFVFAEGEPSAPSRPAALLPPPTGGPGR
jgi:hypothetical protein